MKKRFLMMMLAGVLAFSMIGCGGNDVMKRLKHMRSIALDTKARGEE